MQRKTLLSIIGIIIIVISVGTYVYLKTRNSSTNTQSTSFKDFLPFGIGNGALGNILDLNNGEDGGDNTGGEGSKQNETPKEYLKQITTYKVAGLVPYLEGRLSNQTGLIENIPSIRYVESSNGHIHQFFTDTKDTKEISSSFIPSIHEAIFDGQAKSVVYRYLDSTGKEIESFLGVLGAESGQYLPKNIISLTSSPENSSYFYIKEDLGGGAIGTLFTPAGSKSTKIFNSNFKEWNADWPDESYVYVNTKPSWDTEGAVYSINTSTGIFTKILSGVRGMTSKVNQNSTKMLYSKTTPRGPELNIYTIKSGTTINLGIYTFADKCVFAFNMLDIYCAVPLNAPSENNPDLWYQGIESYSDQIYKINTNTGEYVIVVNTEIKGGIDAVNLVLDKANNSLFFINKKDSTLWSLDLVR